MSQTSIRTAVKPSAQMSRGLFNAALGMPTGTAVHQAGTTLMPTLKKLGTQRKAQPGHIMNSNIPPEFVQAYHEIVQKGTTDKEAIRTALIQEFTDVTPESLRNMLIEQTLQTMCPLPSPHADADERASRAREFAGGGYVREVTLVQTRDFEEYLEEKAVLSLIGKALHVINPDEPPAPPPSSTLAQTPNANRPKISLMKKQNENQLEMPNNVSEASNNSFVTPLTGVSNNNNNFHSAMSHNNNYQSAVANNGSNFIGINNNANERLRQEAEAAAAAATAAALELQRHQQEVQRRIERMRQRQEEEERQQQLAIQPILAFIEGFPIQDVNSLLATEGSDTEENILTAVNYIRRDISQINRVSIGQVLQKIHTFYKKNDDANDMTVHVMAVFTLLAFISERRSIEGSISPLLQKLIRKLKYLSTFKYYGGDTIVSDHSRLMSPRKQEIEKPGVLQAVGKGITSLLPTFGTNNENETPVPVVINKSTMYLDPSIIEILDETIHPSILVFLFPSDLASTRDVNLLIQGNIIQLLYDNGIDKYLNMRSMCISLYKHVQYILNKFFWTPPAPPNLFNYLSFEAETMAEFNARTRTHGRSGYANYMANRNEYNEMIRAHDQRYPVFAGNRNRQHEYESPQMREILGNLVETFEEQEENTKDYVPYEKWNWGTRVFFWVANLAQLSDKAISGYQGIQNNIKQREAFQAAINARADASRAFDPSYVAQTTASEARLSAIFGKAYIPPNVQNFAARQAEGERRADEALRQNREVARVEQKARRKAAQLDAADEVNEGLRDLNMRAFDPREVARVEQKARLATARAEEETRIAEGLRDLNQRAFDPREVARVEQKVRLAQTRGEEQARTNEGLRNLNQRAFDPAFQREFEYRQGEAERIVGNFGVLYTSAATINNRANALPNEANRVINRADQVIESKCDRLLSQKKDVSSLPPFCGAGNPFVEAILPKNIYRSAETKVNENKAERRVVLDENIGQAQTNAGVLKDGINSGIDVVATVNAQASKQGVFTVDNESFRDAVRQADAMLSGLAKPAQDAASALGKAEGSVRNVELAPETIGAAKPSDVRTFLNTPTVEFEAQVGEARQAQHDQEQAQQFLSDLGQFASNAILLAGVAAAAASSGRGGPGPSTLTPRNSEPQEIDPGAIYATTLMPGAEVSEDIIVGHVGSAPHLTKQTNARGEVEYIAVRGRDLGKVNQANLERGMGKDQRPRQRMHYNARVYEEAQRFAGDVFEARGVPLAAETWFPRENVFHANIRPTGNIWEAQLFQGAIPGLGGGYEWRVGDALGVQGIVNMGMGGVGGFTPLRGGRAKTRVHRKFKNKTRKLRGGATPSVEQLLQKIRQVRSYTEINILRFALKVLLQSKHELEKTISREKNPCL